MAYTRKIRIEYYYVVSAKKDARGVETDKVYDLEKLLALADKITLPKRIFNYYQEQARLDKLLYNKVADYWYLDFIRMRQTKIPSTVKRDTVAEPIKLSPDEYIGEEVVALYDIQNHILALQRNRDSLSSTGIEFYLNSLWKNAERQICLRPVPPIDLDEKVGKAKIYRKITVKFANLRSYTYKGHDDSSFKKLLEYFDGYNGQTATLTISLGHTRKDSLNSDTIEETIDILKENVGLVSGAELSYKESEADPVDTIDLFAMKSHDFITIQLEKLQTIEFRELADQIHIRYNKSKEKLLKG